MKYVKKPVVVEAFKYGVDEEPNWFVSAYRPYYPFSTEGIKFDENSIYPSAFAHKGDYIIQDSNGKIYPCKKNIFDASYELYNE